MSSPNAVELILVPETQYGVTPDLATATAAAIRFTTESLSGTPTTTQSQENRTDRQSGGQIVTGLEVGGAINGELSADPVYRLLFQMGMMSDPVAAGAPIPLDGGTFIKDAVNPQLATLTVPGGTLDDDLAVGQAVILGGFVDPALANNGPATVVSIAPDGLSMVVTTAREAVTVNPIPAGAAEVVVPAYLDIGSEVFSATFSKAYTDVLHLVSDDEHSQRYAGGIVNGFTVGLTYGEIAGIVFTLLANGYVQEAPSLSQQIETAGGDITPAGTAEVLNASIDMGMVTVDGLPTEFCIESLSITLDNGNTPQNCLGYIAPRKYVPGTAAITIEATIYLAEPAYDAFMPAKLTQDPVGMFFAVGNQDGGFAFDLAAVQLTFPDPNVTGPNAPVMIDAAGLAKVGDNGVSALRIYYW
jgi:hypothetical protein